ncbi:competence protein CoiA family protein [Planococcus lenghuensis]|uniref:Competence protein CoiA-like N-terminal domain-containing protein n=1 Tax=Planococcus lenghuensis TaxID=2213202 RepID=A0A1Q2L4C3_9BACL|nr:competence protein CoiA family protein [Planococcus lenghuensis]AQQ55271.1 hypothetical protein B0X71_19005 [Planococcus lenghuensis]
MKFAINKGDNSEEFIDQILRIHTISELKKLAQKNIYTCPYCGEPLKVRSGDERGTFFAHLPNRACVESKQVEQAYKQYMKQIKRESYKHSVLVSMIKDELNTASAGREQIEILEGYRVGRFTKFFPDLYVQIGGREWAVTVLTDMTETESVLHAKNFRDRHTYFLQEGLEPLWLIDKANFAEELNKRSIVMWEIEWLSSFENKEDVQWKDAISRYISRKELFEVLGYTTMETDKALKLKSIYYISSIDDKNYIRVFRYIEDQVQGPYRGLLIGETSRIPFGQALQIENESFRLRDPEREQHLREEFKQQFLQLQEEQQTKRRELEERRAKARAEREAANAEKQYPTAESLTTQRQFPADDYRSSRLQSGFRSPYATTRGEQELDEFWHKRFQEKQKKQLKLITDFVPDKKYRLFIERLLTIRVEGAIYIPVSDRVWRKVIMDWLEMNYLEENWSVSVKEMIELLRRSGIELDSQQLKFAAYPVKSFLGVYKKAARTDLRLKGNLAVME